MYIMYSCNMALDITLCHPNITFTSVDFTEKSFEKLPDYSSTGALMTQEEVEELLKKYEK